MKKSYQLSAATFILLMVAVPLFANASWWNPVSWFSKLFHKKTVVVEKVVYVNATSTDDVYRGDNAPNVRETQKINLKESVAVQPRQTNTYQKTPQTNEVLPQESQNLVNITPKPIVTISDQERADIKVNANKVIDNIRGDIDAINSKSAQFKKSKYSSEYLGFFEASQATSDYLEQNIKLTNLLIKASDSTSISAESMRGIYDQWLAIINDTYADMPVFYSGLSKLVQQSNDVVTAIIKLEVIDEVSARNGITPSYGSNTSASDLSQQRMYLEKKADDYIKSLIPEKKEDSKKLIIFINHFNVY